MGRMDILIRFSVYIDQYYYIEVGAEYVIAYSLIDLRPSVMNAGHVYRMQRLGGSKRIIINNRQRTEERNQLPTVT